MEMSFDFGALLRNNEKKHKSKPTQFVSVAGGIQKRLETNIKIRKSTRLTTFDQVRNLAIQESPVKSDAQLKIEHRRQQLEKWKEEKEKKKKEAAAQKKKPFIVGAAHAPIKYLPPPIPPKPSTSGRVTRSQTAKTSINPKPIQKQKVLQSFAPKHASFKPPELKNLVKLPVLAPPKTKSRKVSMITFEPVIHKEKAEKQTHCKTAQKAKPVPQMETRSLRSKMTKSSIPNKNRIPKIAMSSSSSETEAPKPIKRVQTPGPVKSVAKSTKCIPKVLTLSSTERSTSDSDNIQMKPMKSRKSVRDSVQIILDQSPLSYDSQSSFEDQLTTKNITDSEKSNSENSDIEYVINTSPVRNNNSSDTDSGKHSDWEVISGLNKLRNSLSDRSSDVEIIEAPIKTKTPRKSIGRKNTDSGKSSSIELVDKQTPVNKRLSRKSLLVTPKNSVPKSESNSEERLRSPKSPHEFPLTPEQMEVAKKISPCVTLSRGKDNARKEMKWKMSEGLLDVDVGDIEDVEHFRRQLASEKARMTEMCDTWEKIAEQTQLPDSVQEAVLSAVGQARLLMSKKLCQFAGLVERCARPEPGSALVTPADLHGFWDMVFMQVENIDTRFKKLEELKEHNWVEKPLEVQKKVVRAAKKIAKPAGNSRIKDMIAAARKAKKDQETVPPIEEPSEPVKTFEGGFFSVRSPVRSPRPSLATPNNKPNLLKAVLSSEAKKASASKKLQNSASFAMLRASLMSKCSKDDTGLLSELTTPQLTPINLYATPGRSILKSTNKASGKKSGKNAKLVLFHDSDLDSSFSSTNMYTARENNSSKIDGVEELSMHDEIEDNSRVLKETKKTLKRQNATEVEERVVMTRRERRNSRKSLNQTENDLSETEFKGRVTRSTTKSVTTPKVSENKTREEKSPKKSARKSKGAENKTPKEKSTRKNKNTVTEDSEDLIQLKTPKKSLRKKALQEVEVNVLEEQSVSTPKRKSKSRKSAVQQVLT